MGPIPPSANATMVAGGVAAWSILCVECALHISTMRSHPDVAAGGLPKPTVALRAVRKNPRVVVAIFDGSSARAPCSQQLGRELSVVAHALSAAMCRSMGVASFFHRWWPRSKALWLKSPCGPQTFRKQCRRPMVSPVGAAMVVPQRRPGTGTSKPSRCGRATNDYSRAIATHISGDQWLWQPPKKAMGDGSNAAHTMLCIYAGEQELPPSTMLCIKHMGPSIPYICYQGAVGPFPCTCPSL